MPEARQVRMNKTLMNWTFSMNAVAVFQPVMFGYMSVLDVCSSKR